jgi:hypothetical protein
MLHSSTIHRGQGANVFTCCTLLSDIAPVGVLWALFSATHSHHVFHRACILFLGTHCVKANEEKIASLTDTRRGQKMKNRAIIQIPYCCDVTLRLSQPWECTVKNSYLAYIKQNHICPSISSIWHNDLYQVC